MTSMARHSTVCNVEKLIFYEDGMAKRERLAVWLNRCGEVPTPRQRWLCYQSRADLLRYECSPVFSSAKQTARNSFSRDVDESYADFWLPVLLRTMFYKPFSRPEITSRFFRPQIDQEQYFVNGSYERS
jgi:hypothetical protein